MFDIKQFVKETYADKFKRYLILVLFLLGFVLMFRGGMETPQAQGMYEVHFFFHPTCPHCHEQMDFNEFMMRKYLSLTFVYHDVSTAEGAEMYVKYAEEYNVGQQQRGVPGTFFGGYKFIGFDKPETTGKKIEEAIVLFLESGGLVDEVLIVDTSFNDEKLDGEGKVYHEGLEPITIPFLGEIDVMNYSLPSLAIVLGLVDGFNPCAMWVLVYLISLIISMKDKRKIWLLVGSFVIASGVLYFLFMTAWLNVFLLIGFIRPLTIAIGLFALGIGILNVKEYIETKGALLCKVGDAGSKKKTLSKIEKIVHSPLTWTTVGGIIVLAFIVNSIEFVCSSAIPAVFTQVLAISNLSVVQYYLYMGKYMKQRINGQSIIRK